MKAIRFEKAGKPADILQVVEVELPQPKAGEVRIHVKASPINPSDIMFVQNRYGIRPVFPSGAGFEGMGVIDAVGEGVNLPVGMRVSFTSIGAWAEYTLVNAKAVMPIPDAMSDEVGAQLFVNPFTAYAMVKDSGVQASEWLMFTAAGSAFGKMVIQLCKMKGIKTIGTVRRPDLIDELKALGADEIINIETESVSRRVKEITGGQGVKCILEAVAGKTAAAVLPCLSAGGKMLIYGALSLEDIPVNAAILIFKSISIQGFWLTDWMKTASAEDRKEVYETVIQLLTTGQVQLPIEARYSLDQIGEAVTHADAVGRWGKVLVIP